MVIPRPNDPATASRMSQVSEQLQFLSNACSRLEDTVKMLFERLERITDNSKPVGEKANKAEAEMLVPLAADIATCKRRMLGCATDIDELLNRLEL